MSLPALESGLLLHFNCSICGFLIIGHRDVLSFYNNLEQHGVSCNAASEWLSEFRAFHSKESFLSGTGRNSGPDGMISGRVPLEPHKHCDDESYQDSDSITFDVRSRSFPRLEPENVGYPIHESCWQILNYQAQLYGIEDLANSRYTDFLYRLHHSTLDGLGRDWAGDYGGLLDAVGQLIIPAVHDATFNPVDIKPISVLVEQAQAKDMASMDEKPIFGRLRDPQSQASLAAVKYSKTGPPLHTLPLEVILMIVKQLSIPDLLNFWIASPAVPDYLTHTFWRSRFKHRMEFGHLFEFREIWHSSNVHWYTLFWKVKDLSLSADAGPAIRNRRRILPVADHMAGLVSKYADKPLEGKEKAPSCRILLETDGFLGDRAQLTLPPPQEIQSFHISTVQLGSRRYISGLRINDNASGLGYFHKDSCETFLVDTTSHGFVQEILCYLDSMGIRGLYLVTDRGFEVGRIYEPVSIDQLSQGILPPGKRLIGHFDATKFTALGVDSLLTKPQDSRYHLLWREAPPEDTTVDIERHLYHKIHKQYRAPWDIRYNPVQYHLFNTRDSLVKITGYVGYFNVGLIGLEFAYQSRDSPHNTPTTCFYGVREGTPMHFPVDGPGGEYITGLTITTVSSVVLAPVVSLSTNYDRSIRFCLLKALDKLEGSMQRSHYTPGPDEYIAGLMWASGGDTLGRIWNFGILCRSSHS